jgi:hypothetical protein
MVMASAAVLSAWAGAAQRISLGVTAARRDLEVPGHAAQTQVGSQRREQSQMALIGVLRCTERTSRPTGRPVDQAPLGQAQTRGGSCVALEE